MACHCEYITGKQKEYTGTNNVIVLEVQARPLTARHAVVYSPESYN